MSSPHPVVHEEKQTWPWPFRLSNLTAGLRRALGKPGLQVLRVTPLTFPQRRPAIGRLQALRVEYRAGGENGDCTLVLKEPRGTTRMGLAGAGRREVGVYHSLAPHLPIATPRLIAASSIGDWLVMEFVSTVIDPQAWTAAQYRTAVSNLADLHDRFWGLGGDLETFAWLAHPLEADLPVHVFAASQAIERVLREGEPRALASNPKRMQLLEALTQRAREVVAPLLRQPATLLHGDYWPGNIAVLEDGRHVLYDWQLASVGPGVLDLLTFVNKSAWWFGGLPLDAGALVEDYRAEIERRTGAHWTEPDWQELWDHALMWRFLQEWVDLLAAAPEALLETRSLELDEIWLDPVSQAMARRLGGL